MSDPQSGNKTDPFEQWRSMRDAYMEAWAKAMVEGVNTDAYAKTSGAVLDAYLTASAPFREALEKAMLEALKQLGMPSRADVVSMAERLTNIERRLDDLEIKLDQIATGLGKVLEAQLALTVAEMAVPSVLEDQVATPAEAAESHTPGVRKAVKKGSR